MNGISALLKEDKRSWLAFFHVKMQQEGVILKQRASSHLVLILDFLASSTVRNKLFLFLSLRYFLLAT
jgi:hypothetical protein